MQNHYFGIIDNKYLLKIIEKMDNQQKLNIIEKMIISKLFRKLNYEKYNCISFPNEILSNMKCYEEPIYIYNKHGDKSNIISHFCNDIIANSNISYLIRNFSNLDEDTLFYLKQDDISRDQYFKYAQPVIDLFAQARKEKKAIIHFGL